MDDSVRSFVIGVSDMRYGYAMCVQGELCVAVSVGPSERIEMRVCFF